MRRSVALLVATSLVALAGATPAQAALTQLTVRIEGRTKTLFEGPIVTEGHNVSSYKADGGSEAEDLAEHSCDGINSTDPADTTPAATPTAAAVDAMNTIGEADALAGRWYASLDDYFVEQWGQAAEDAEAGSRSWGLLVNNVFTNIGGCQYELSGGDEVLWVYNAFESRPVLGLFAADEHYGAGTRPLIAQAQLNRPFAVEVAAYDDHGEGQPPATPERTSQNTQPYEGALVAPVATSEKGVEAVQTQSSEAVGSNSEGKASITFTTPGWHRIMAGAPLDEKGEEAAIRSNRLDVCVLAEGQSGCGAPPAEDAVRTPPRYMPPAQGGEEQRQTPQPGGGEPPRGVAEGGSSSAAAPVSGQARGVVIQSVSSRRLVLRFAASGRALVRVAHRAGRRSRHRWQTVKTIAVYATKPGPIDVALPALAAGSYRVSVSFAGKQVVGKLIVRQRRG